MFGECEWRLAKSWCATIYIRSGIFGEPNGRDKSAGGRAVFACFRGEGEEKSRNCEKTLVLLGGFDTFRHLVLFQASVFKKVIFALFQFLSVSLRNSLI